MWVIVNEGVVQANGDPRAAAASQVRTVGTCMTVVSSMPRIPREWVRKYYIVSRRLWFEIYKLADRSVDIGVVELSRATDPALDFSCILVATRLQNMPELGVAVYIILLAETGEEIQPYSDQIYDRYVMIYRVPSDCDQRHSGSQSSADYRAAYKQTRCSSLTAQSVNSNFKIQLTRPRFIVWLWLLQWLVLPNSILGHLVSKISSLANLNKRGQASGFDGEHLLVDNSKMAAGNVYRSWRAYQFLRS